MKLAKKIEQSLNVFFNYVFINRFWINVWIGIKKEIDHIVCDTNRYHIVRVNFQLFNSQPKPVRIVSKVQIELVLDRSWNENIDWT